MVQDFFDDFGVFDGGNDFDFSAAFLAVFDVDVETLFRSLAQEILFAIVEGGLSASPGEATIARVGTSGFLGMICLAFILPVNRGLCESQAL